MSLKEKPAGASGGLSEIVSWQERTESSPEALRSQAFAIGRQHEREARRRALDAISLNGAAAFNKAALARFYARSAMNLMVGGAYV